ncbi:MAG TPA: LLM class flavin-dependent oxidoreductase, partial [Myxococcota bacterium]|nr:LLM class flavin-dependent oxidoreductase [Myxococcota bacterium]
PDDPTVGDGVEAVLEFVRGGFVPVGPGGTPLVDARDLARVIVALLVPGRGPRRFMAGGHWIAHEELAQLLESLTGRTLLRLRLPSALVRLLGHLGDVASRLGAPTPLRSETTATMLGMVPSDDSALARELGVTLRPTRETLEDTLRWALREGRLRASEAGLLAPPPAAPPLPWRIGFPEEAPMPARELHFGVFLPQIALPWPEIEARVLRAEALGYHSVWLMDHLWAPGAEERDSLEAWTLATALAARTARIRLGHLVLCNAFRHPALLAKMAATLDHVSGGRLELGLGWGSVPAELAAFGVGDEPPAVRAAKLRESLEILRLLWTGERVSYEGRYFRLKDAIGRPVPLQPRIPIHVGGAGPKLTLPIVRDHADWWNCMSTGVSRLDELRAQVGQARVSVQHPVALAADAAERDAVRARAEKRFAGWGGVLSGTADEVAAVLAREARAGVELFIAAFADGGRPETLERFARDVIPAVRASA